MFGARRQGKRGARQWGLWALAVLWLVHGLWVLKGRGPAGILSRAGSALSQPFLRASGRIESWQAGRGRRHTDLAQAQANVDYLRAEVEALRLEAARQAPRLAEAEELVRLSGLRQQLPLELKPGRILVNTRRAPYGGFVLDQGEDAGFRPDQGVIAPEGVVGRLWEVGAHQASVLPLDAYNASTSVMLAGSRATGILQGTGPGRAEIRYIGSQEIVQPGERVLTSGLDGVFPRGLLVGTVSRVQARDLELEVEVLLAAPLDRLHLVLVVPFRPPSELAAPAQPPAIPVQKGGGR